MSSIEEKVFCINGLRLLILSYILDNKCKICNISEKESYYKYSSSYPDFCLFCIPLSKEWKSKKIRYKWKREYRNFNRATFLKN
jgi:hypothetical protein